MQSKLEKIIENAVTELGYEFVGVTVSNSGRKIVEVLIDTIDSDAESDPADLDNSSSRMIKVADCRAVSHHLSAILDVEDQIEGKYFLEVSSAGAERPLTKFADYKRFKGRHAKIMLYQAEQHPTLGPRIRFKGEIVDVEEKENNQVISLHVDDLEIKIDFKNIKKAHLILTDEQFRKLINRNKGAI